MSPKSSDKIRLDKLLFEKKLVESREKAKALILEGLVLVNGSVAAKAGSLVSPDEDIKIEKKMPYVSRGGLKLEHAIKSFKIDVNNRVSMDVGASTGGFTDCLLQNGAERVYAIDVGYGQFSWKLRNDRRVTLFEKTNIRYLDATSLPEKIDIAVIDVSFISLLKVIPKVMEFLKASAEIVALIKPQFEVGKNDVGKGGVVRDPERRIEVVDKVKRGSERLGLNVEGMTESPIKGPKGNIEYLIYLRR